MVTLQKCHSEQFCLALIEEQEETNASDTFFQELAVIDYLSLQNFWLYKIQRHFYSNSTGPLPVLLVRKRQNAEYSPTFLAVLDIYK